MVRLVTKDLRIYDLVVRVGIFQDSLNAEAICNHTINNIQNRLGIKIENRITSMCNNYATDRENIGRVRVNYSKANPVAIVL